MKDEYDFTGAEQGKFYRPIEELDIPRIPMPAPFHQMSDHDDHHRRRWPEQQESEGINDEADIIVRAAGSALHFQDQGC